MPRTTLDLDASVLRELKRRKRTTGRTVGQLASELLAGALAEQTPAELPRPSLRWHTASMKARIDIEDKEALNRALDER